MYTVCVYVCEIKIVLLKIYIASNTFSLQVTSETEGKIEYNQLSLEKLSYYLISLLYLCL